MASLTWTRVLAQKRQVRLILCLVVVLPKSLRPILARETRPTRRAAAARWARVLAWLRRRSEHRVSTQAIATDGCMAVPPRRGGQGWLAPTLVRPLPCGGNRLPFLPSCKLGMTQVA